MKCRYQFHNVIIPTVLLTVCSNQSQAAGYSDPHITQANIQQTICVAGYTAEVRPSTYYTTQLKTRQIRDLKLTGTPSEYEEDHIIPLALGGAAKDPRNLKPQLWSEAKRKDVLERKLQKKVCGGHTQLRDAQRCCINGWKSCNL